MPRRWSWLCSLLLAGCLTGGVNEGGGATETGNGLHLVVLAEDGSPAALARVRLVRSDSWMGDIGDSGAPRGTTYTTDDRGEVVVAPPVAGRWNLQAQWGSQGGLEPLDTRLPRPRLALRPLARVRRLIQGWRPARVWVAGSAWSAAVGSDGWAELYLPPGVHAMVGQSGQKLVSMGSVRAEAWNSLVDTFGIDPRRVVLDDFSGGQKASLFHAITGRGWWYGVTDGESPVQMRMDSGHLAMDYTLRANAGYAIAGLAFMDDSVYHPVDLSGMDSLCLEVRGNADLNVVFHRVTSTGAIDLTSSAAIGGLSPAWRRVCIARGSFGEGWSQVASVGNDLAFVTSKGSWFQLRGLEVWGVPLEDIAR